MKHLILGLGGIGGNIVRLVREKAPNHIYALLDSDMEHCQRWQAEGIPCVCFGSPHRLRTLTELAAHLHPEQWFPQDPQLLSRQADYSNGHRITGRLLFEVALAQGRMQSICRLLEELLQGPALLEGADITVVTTLSGGTGSGCMLPLALWLRRTLQEQYHINPCIRGVFLLPEALFPAFHELPGNRTDYLYCNATAALKELDAIEHVFAGTRTFPHFSLGDLFDSTRDHGTGSHVFDHCYVVGEQEHCRDLLSVTERTADAVYALTNLQCIRSTEGSIPVSPQLQYRAIGAAAARYPSHRIWKYCTARLIHSVLDDPWYSLDREVLQRRANAKIKPPYADVYRQVFLESVKADPHSLPARQTCDTAGCSDPEKPEQFLRRVAAVVNETAEGLFQPELPEPVKESALSKQVLEDMLQAAIHSVRRAVTSLDDQARELAEEMAEQLLPYYSPIPDDGAGILLSHRGEAVHPAAARYLIYDICDRMQQKLYTMGLKQTEQQLMDTLTCLCPATADKHLHACQDQLQSVFRKLQQQFAAYRSCILLDRLYEVLIEHFRALADNYEAIFRIMPKIREILSKDMEPEPVKSPTTYWFCCAPNALEDIYQEVKTRVCIPVGVLHDQLRILVEKYYLEQGFGMIGVYPTAPDVIQKLTEPFRTALDSQCGQLLNPDLFTALQLHHRQDDGAPEPSAAWLAECADVLLPLAKPARILGDRDFSEHRVTFHVLKPGYPMHLIPAQPSFSSEAAVPRDALMRVDIHCGIRTYDLLHGSSYLLAHYMQQLKPLIGGHSITPHLDTRWHKFL